MRRTIRWNAIFGVATIVIGLAYVASPVQAADGFLDTSFGVDGLVITNLGSTDNGGRSVAIQPDGKILVAGNSRVSGGYDFTVTRYNTTGSLDESFGTAGITTTNLGGTNDVGNSIAIQSDGKIVVAGFSDVNSLPHFALTRYNTTGSLDESFGTAGITTTILGGTNDIGYSVAIQPDGKIVVAGFSNKNGGYDFALTRYNTNGSLDTTGFGTAGIAITNFGGSDDRAYSVAIQTNGKIVVAGSTNVTDNYQFALARYNTNGSLDESFATLGKLITTVGGTDEGGSSVAIQPDGKIVVAGFSNVNGGGDFALTRYNTNGFLDESFGNEGITTTNFGGSDDRAFSVAIQPDGKIVAGGSSDMADAYQLALARYNANGILDESFATLGKLLTTFGGTDEGGNSVAIQPDGKILFAGYSDLISGYAIALARYEATPLAVTLAASTTTSSLASITFTVTGTGTIDCTSLSTTAGVDFNLTGISAITSITQTSSTVCTIAATSSATTGDGAVTSTLAAASSFSIGFTYDNTRTSITDSLQSVIVTLPTAAPTTTTVAPTTTSTVAPTTTTVATVITASAQRVIETKSELPVTGSNSSPMIALATILLLVGLVVITRRRITS